jgi:hypothetical protein
MPTAPRLFLGHPAPYSVGTGGPFLMIKHPGHVVKNSAIAKNVLSHTSSLYGT